MKGGNGEMSYGITIHFDNIYNLSKEDLKKLFTSVMEKRGLKLCHEDNADYVVNVAFSKNNKWFSISSYYWDSNNKKSDQEIQSILSLIKLPLLKVSDIDGEFSKFDLYDTDGNLLDVAYIGNTSEYLTNKSMLKKHYWEPFVIDGYTFQDLNALCDNDNSDSDSKFAHIIGIDRLHIDADSAVYTLSFAHKKQVNFKNIFSDVIGNRLEKANFIKLKTKYPYWVRLIDNEVIQIITYDIPRQDKNSFLILTSLQTVYSLDLNLDESVNMLPKFTALSSFYTLTHTNDFSQERKIQTMRFKFEQGQPDSIINSCEQAWNEISSIILPWYDKIKTIYDLPEYSVNCPGICMLIFNEQPAKCAESLIFLLYDDPIGMLEKYKTLQLEKAKTDLANTAEYSDECDNIFKKHNFCKEILYNFLNNPISNAEVLTEIQKRKKTNQDLLRKWGFDI